MKVRKIDHVAIAVRSIEDAVRLFVDTLGGTFVAGGDNPQRGIRTVQLMLGGFKVELMQPLDADNYLGRFIDKHGEGFHHLTMFVESVDDAVVSLEQGGYRAVETENLLPGWKETYVSPRSGFGALLQLVETDIDLPAVFGSGIELADVVAGRVEWVEGSPILSSAGDGESS